MLLIVLAVMAKMGPPPPQVIPVGPVRVQFRFPRSRKKRIRNYMREWLDGTCVLACGKCNKKLGAPTDEEPIPP